MSDVHERLRRLLFVVPYVARHRGVTVDALAKQLGVSREELLRARQTARLLVRACRPRHLERAEGFAPDVVDRALALHEGAVPGHVRGALSRHPLLLESPRR